MKKIILSVVLALALSTGIVATAPQAHASLQAGYVVWNMKGRDIRVANGSGSWWSLSNSTTGYPYKSTHYTNSAVRFYTSDVRCVKPYSHNRVYQVSAGAWHTTSNYAQPGEPLLVRPKYSGPCQV